MASSIDRELYGNARSIPSGLDVTSIWCPIVGFLRPDYRVLQERTNAWATKLAVFGHSSRLESIGAGELAGRTNMLTADSDAVQLASDILLWLFAFDDAYCDRGRYSHDPAQLAILTADMMRVAESGGSGQSPLPLVRGLSQLRDRVESMVSAAFFARWLGALRGYLAYQVWEAAFRATRTMPSVDQYAVARIRSGSMELCAMTINIGDEEVTADQMGSREVRALTEMTCLIVGLDNDLLSYYKEHEATGDRLNIVDVIAHQQLVPLNTATEHAVAFRDAVLRRFLAVRAQVASTGSPAMRRYCEGLGDWIRGNLDWSLNTARYPSPERRPSIVCDEPPALEFVPPAGIAWWWSCFTERG